MTVERKMALFGLDSFSTSSPVAPGFEEDLVSSFLSPKKRHVIVGSDDQIRVNETYIDEQVIYDRTLKGQEINRAKIDNSEDGLLGRIIRISYRYTPTQA